jgi:hypothetical protein
MPEFSCSHYYTYAEITELLEGWVEEYGDVCELSSIGTSLEGRELWLLTGARPSPARPPKRRLLQLLTFGTREPSH